MRTNLKVFRVKHRMTQAEMADAIGVGRGQYASVESGARSGSTAFWNALQKTFAIPDSCMWELTKSDNKKRKER